MIDEYRETIGHNRGYPTGLSHEEKMDVIACLLDDEITASWFVFPACLSLSLYSLNIISYLLNVYE